MADQKSLRMIGVGFAAITGAVMLIAALTVAEASRATAEPDRPQTIAASASLSI